MFTEKLKIVPLDLLSEYIRAFDSNLVCRFEDLSESELTIESFNFYVSVSAVFSSKIEGEDIDLDSFIKHKRFSVEYQKDYTQKIDDLYNAYLFAQSHKLNKENILFIHKELTKNILPAHKQGKYRTGNMFVVTSEGKIDYVAPIASKIEFELEKFYTDLELLLTADLSFEEIFYFASFLHLIFVKIHPFEDGNGRTARLIEKCFLAEKLGEKAWFISSEKNYYENRDNYYSSIRKIGNEYETLQYSNSMNFLELLPSTLNSK
jgi:Fic family protein